MIISDVIKRVDDLRQGCDVSLCDYIYRLNVLESDIHGNIISRHEGSYGFVPHTSEDDELTVPDTYADLYVFYLLAHIDLANGDTHGYTNNMILYNSLISEFSRYYTRTHMPKQSTRIGWS